MCKNYKQWYMVSVLFSVGFLCGMENKSFDPSEQIYFYLMKTALGDSWHVEKEKMIDWESCDFNLCGVSASDNSTHTDRFFADRRLNDSTQFKKQNVKKQNGGYSCSFPGCRKTFYRKCHFVSHYNKHYKLRPFVCPLPGCQKCYAGISGLRKYQAKSGH